MRATPAASQIVQTQQMTFLFKTARSYTPVASQSECVSVYLVLLINMVCELVYYLYHLSDLCLVVSYASVWFTFYVQT